MRIAVIIVRVLMGLLFIFSVVAYSAIFFKLVPQPEITGNAKIFTDGVNVTGYFMPLVKITELLCGIAFVSGFYVPLATVVIAPIIINIFLFHVFVDTSGMPVGIFLVLANLFLAYANWDKFKPLLQAK